MQKLQEIDVKSHRVLVRVDFNVPLNAAGGVAEDARMIAALPTLQYILEQGGKLIVASHLGRPKGVVNPKFSLKPVAAHLEKMLQRKVRMAPESVGSAVEEEVAQMVDGDVIVLENLRFHVEEQADDDNFAKQLAALCDVYVNDAFAVCHRANASVSAITRHVTFKTAGFLLQKELNTFAKVSDQPARPVAAVVGGAKVSSKLKAIENLIDKVDLIFIGGAMANTFLAAQEMDMGRSLLEPDLIKTAGDVLVRAKDKGIDCILPVDIVAAKELKPGVSSLTCSVDKIPSQFMAFDIGPETVALFTERLAAAKTVVWNGPMGVFETSPFDQGTLGVANAIADLNALTIVGGGDTVAAVNRSDRSADFSYLSTGGGAFLTLMEGKPLVAVAALEEL
jgi:phosphoglycerate kinase